MYLASVNQRELSELAVLYQLRIIKPSRKKWSSNLFFELPKEWKSLIVHLELIAVLKICDSQGASNRFSLLTLFAPKSTVSKQLQQFEKAGSIWSLHRT